MNLTIKDFFKHYLHYEPTDAQFYLSLIMMSWSLKLFYGMIFDNVSFFRSHRRSYFIAASIITSLSLVPLFFDECYKYKYFILIMLFIYQVGQASVDVITDGCLVAVARKCRDHGSSDLQSMNLIYHGIGGIIGSLAAVYMTENFHPKFTFMIFTGIALGNLFFSAYTEEDETLTSSNGQFIERMKENMSQLKKFMITNSVAR